MMTDSRTFGKPKSLLLVAAVLALLGSFVLTPLAASAQTEPVTVPVTGSGPGNSGITFDGTLEIVEFVVEDGELVAVGTLSGDLLTRSGRLIATITDQPVRFPVNVGQAASCEVLFLELGPIELRLLGLHLNIDQITIDLTAVPSEGILGQLLCALAGGIDLDDLLGELGITLDQLLQQVADLLNDLLGSLSTA